MLPAPPELLDLLSADRRRRESLAVAERLRRRGGLRSRAAHLLRELADRLAPVPSLPSGDGEPVCVRRATRSRLSSAAARTARTSG